MIVGQSRAGFHFESVLAVQRKVVVDENAAVRAEGQTLRMFALRSAFGTISCRRAAHRWIAHRQAADLLRGRDVSLQQRGRNF